MENTTLFFFSLLLLLNVAYVIYVSIIDCKEKKRKKLIEKRKQLYEEKIELKTKKNALASPAKKAPLDPIAEQEDEESKPSQRSSPKSSRCNRKARAKAEFNSKLISDGN